MAAVDNVNLDVPAGQMVGIIGRSEAGKSTLLRMINPLTDPTLEWRARCAMVFQQFNLVPRLQVLTNVMVGRLSYHPTLPGLLSFPTMIGR